MTVTIRITEAHHADNQFYELFETEFDTEESARLYLADIPAPHAGHNCDTADICYMADLVTDEGLVDDRETNRAWVMQIVGITEQDMNEARAAARIDIEASVQSFMEMRDEKVSGSIGVEDEWADMLEDERKWLERQQ